LKKKLNKIKIYSIKDKNKSNYLPYFILPSVAWILSITAFFLKLDFYFFVFSSIFLTIFSILILNYYVYVIDDFYLKIKIGFFTLFKISINQIEYIDFKRKSHKIYGLSNDFISIKVKKTRRNEEINISPIDKELLIKHLISMNPSIVLKNNL